jgi:hypothetical protein
VNKWAFCPFGLMNNWRRLEEKLGHTRSHAAHSKNHRRTCSSWPMSCRLRMMHPDLGTKDFWHHNHIADLSSSLRQITSATDQVAIQKARRRKSTRLIAAERAIGEIGHCIGQRLVGAISPLPTGRRATQKDRPRRSAERETDIRPFLVPRMSE